MLDGHLLVDAHVHVPNLSTLTPAWRKWAEDFGRPGLLGEGWRSDGSPDPAALDALFADEGVDVALLFCEYSPKATGYQTFDDLLPIVEHNPAGSGRSPTSTRTCIFRSIVSCDGSSTSARRR